jgi:large subunit ribosomal protein L22
MQAQLTSHNQAPRKVRLVTELVKGKKIPEALAALAFLPKRASLPVTKLIQSAVANAVQKGENVEDLRIQNITVDSAGMIVRMMPRAMGRGAPIRHRKSLIRVTLSSTSAARLEKKAPKAKAKVKVPAKKTEVAAKAKTTTPAKKKVAAKAPAA